MSGIIPDGVVTLRVSWGETVTLRFPVRVKVTAVAFVADTADVSPGEGWALEATKYRLAADYAETSDSISVGFCDPAPFLGVNESYVLSSVATPVEKAAWSDDVERDVAQMDPDEWLEFVYYKPGVGGSDADIKATITVAYTGATNLD